MNKPIAVLLVAGLTLTACNSWRNSRVNPTNWFGSSTSTPVETAAPVQTNPLIPQQAATNSIFARPEAEDRSVPITTIAELRIDPTPTGAIVDVTGVANRQGAFGAELRLSSSDDEIENGILTYTFLVTYPEAPTPQGTERSRTIRQAISLSNKELASVRVIRIVGKDNTRESRRR